MKEAVSPVALPAAAAAAHLIASTEVARALPAVFNVRSKEKGGDAR